MADKLPNKRKKRQVAKRAVALIIHDGVQALDVAGPLDVLAEANALIAADVRYDCVLLAGQGGPIRASNGMTMTAHLTFAEAERAAIQIKYSARGL